MVLDADGKEIVHAALCPVCGQQFICKDEEEAALAANHLDKKVDYLIKAIYEQARARMEGRTNVSEDTGEADAGK